MKKYIIPGIILLITCTLPAIERKRAVAFDHISIEDGLSQSTILCFFQDSKGFMWFGSTNGLNKYDGKAITVYNVKSNSPGLRGRVISAVREDNSGALWIGSLDNGLNKFDPVTETFTWFPHNPNDPDSPGADAVISLHYDRNQILWLGTQGGGLDAFDLKTGSFTHYKHNPGDPNSPGHNSVISILEDRDGMLWLGTPVGLDKFNPKTRTFSHYFSRNGNTSDPRYLSHHQVQAIYEDHSGTLWIGTAGGLNKFDPQTQTFTHYKNDPRNPASLGHDNVWAIYEDRDNVLWIGTERGGLNILDRETGTFTCYKHNPQDPRGLSNDFITSIFGDRSGVLWIGTGNNGIHTLDKSRYKFTHNEYIPGDPNSISDNSVFAVHRDREGNMWIGTLGGGLDKYDLEKGLLIRHYAHQPGNPHSLSHNSVYSIHSDREGNIWIGTRRGGLNKFDPGKERFIHYRNDPENPGTISCDIITSVCEDRDGTLWIGTGKGGLDKFDRKTGTFTHFRHDPRNADSISSDLINYVKWDRTGILWIGTRGAGLNKYDPEKGRFTRYRFNADEPGSLSDDAVSFIHEPESAAFSKVLWIGTWSGGLNMFNRESGKFASYTTEHGLPNDTIYGILEDIRGNLWISTNKGLSRFTPSTGRFINYGLRDGIQDYEFNQGSCYKSPEGEMFFGGINGINSFFPHNIRENPHIPPIVITGFKLFDQSVKTGGGSLLQKSVTHTQKITLSYKQNIFSFRFAALDYTYPRKNQYRYKVEGLHDNWIYLGYSNEVAFAGMKPGEYIFRVFGSNNDGVWNEEGAALKIIVKPPFWETSWFRAVVVFFLGLSIYLLFRAYTKRLTLQLETEKAMNRLYTRNRISAREQDILHLLLKGKSNKEIEDTLFISLSTVKTHVYNIYKKLKVKNRVELIRLIQQSVKSE